MAVCHYHNDRPGIGICMRCRVVICSSCCTRLDGVNHCHACLKQMGQRDVAAPSAGIPAIAEAILVLGMAWVFLTMAFWAIQGQLAP